MTRRIYCRKCGNGWQLHPEDTARGVESRRLLLKIGPVPIGHGYTVKIQGQPDQHHLMSSIVCDRCGDPIPRGDRAWAITTWRSEREGEPGEWESEFGSLFSC